ncbi:MAG: hypothetical protein WAV73_02145 [Candidatus Moraniibacteriota bacterium]
MPIFVTVTGLALDQPEIKENLSAKLLGAIRGIDELGEDPADIYARVFPAEIIPGASNRGVVDICVVCFVKEAVLMNEVRQKIAKRIFSELRKIMTAEDIKSFTALRVIIKKAKQDKNYLKKIPSVERITQRIDLADEGCFEDLPHWRVFFCPD